MAFAPVTSEDLASHTMHAEWFRIPAATASAIDAARKRGGRILAVGTTTVRALESAASPDIAHAACEKFRTSAS